MLRAPCVETHSRGRQLPLFLKRQAASDDALSIRLGIQGQRQVRALHRFNSSRLYSSTVALLPYFECAVLNYPHKSPKTEKENRPRFAPIRGNPRFTTPPFLRRETAPLSHRKSGVVLYTDSHELKLIWRIKDRCLTTKSSVENTASLS
jgi:hypothetical protein